MEFKTKLTKAKPTGETLRTTVPLALLQLWEVESGDEVKWEIEIMDNEAIVKVRPVKKESPE